MYSPKISIGADIGGTHITCAAVQVQDGHLLQKSLSRATYDHNAPAQVILESWAKALNNTLSQLPLDQVAGIGFAIPGPFEYQNGISRMEHKFKHLYGLHIPSALNPLLNTALELPMRFLNDASSFAVGEAWTGEGQGFQKVVVITLGTGFGSAFTEDGVPVVSGNSVPKEGCLWHLPFLEGIADDYFSTRWFTREYQKRGGRTIKGVKELMDISKSDVLAGALFQEFGHNLAACLKAPLQQFGAEILIIGGNIAHALPLFGEVFQDDLKKAGVSVRVIVSKHSEHAALIGSARLLEEAFWKKVSENMPNI